VTFFIVCSHGRDTFASGRCGGDPVARPRDRWRIAAGERAIARLADDWAADWASDRADEPGGGREVTGVKAMTRPDLSVRGRGPRGPLCLRGLLALVAAVVVAAPSAAQPPALGGDAARRIVGAHRGGPLAVDARGIDAAAAAVLAGFPGDLALDRLDALSPEAATALAAHRGPLSLAGLASLPPAVALGLRRHESILWLDGLATLSPDTAAALASHPGPLVLDGVTVLAPKAALALPAVRTISWEAFRALGGGLNPAATAGLSFMGGPATTRPGSSPSPAAPQRRSAASAGPGAGSPGPTRSR